MGMPVGRLHLLFWIMVWCVKANAGFKLHMRAIHCAPSLACLLVRVVLGFRALAARQRQWSLHLTACAVADLWLVGKLR